MDRRKEACSIVKAVNEYKNKQIEDYELIKKGL